jgi:DNA-binding CsgD family transcriptional regulator
MNTALTRSEFEIAQRIALGQSKKEVAYYTHRSVYTVETTVKNIYSKLGFNKVSDLVLWYCGQHFGISLQITELKKKIIATCLLLLIAVDLFNIDTEMIRSRRVRSRRRQEIELIIS